MDSPRVKHHIRFVGRTLVCASLVLASFFGSFQTIFQPQTVHALTLEQQLAQKQAQIKAAQEAKAKKDALAALAARKVTEVTGQIATLESNITETQKNITTTQGNIENENQNIAVLESNLRRIQDQQDALVRQLYITAISSPSDLTMFSSQSVSEQEQKKAQMRTIKNSVAQLFAETQAQKMEVEAKRDALARKSDSLEDLKDQQGEQKKGLANFKATQTDLQKDAQTAAQKLQTQIAADTAAAAAIAEKIRILAATRNWGGQIVSSNDSSWYYTQTGNYTRFRGTIYTVNDYGCLITSIAMIATYYGNSVTPTYIAQNGVFTGGGYLVSLPAGLGVSVGGSRGVDWSVVDSELAKGRPVIISIYLPSVGAVNSDGSSHFVVVKGKADGKYLMHDPIGDGRGYNLNQVKSMKLVTKQ